MNLSATHSIAPKQNSVIALSDGVGNPVQRRAYGTYGETDPAQMVGNTAHPFGYTGRRYDPDLGLYYYRARWYDPSLGTFLQTDPIGSLDYINLYSYVGLEPGNATDPTGMYVCSANKNQCSVIRSALAQARAARDTYRRNSTEYRRIDAAVSSYGTEGVKNGVIVKAGVLHDGVLAQVGQNGKEITATFDFAQLYGASQAPVSLSGGGGIYAGVVGHEGKHIWQHQMGGHIGRSNSFSGREQLERPAYLTQVAIMTGLGVRASTLEKTRFVEMGTTRSSRNCAYCDD
jgi:RHS repeat-associated protein